MSASHGRGGHPRLREMTIDEQEKFFNEVDAFMRSRWKKAENMDMSWSTFADTFVDTDTRIIPMHNVMTLNCGRANADLQERFGGRVYPGGPQPVEWCFEALGDGSVKHWIQLYLRVHDDSVLSGRRAGGTGAWSSGGGKPSNEWCMALAFFECVIGAFLWYRFHTGTHGLW